MRNHPFPFVAHFTRVWSFIVPQADGKCKPFFQSLSEAALRGVVSFQGGRPLPLIGAGGREPPYRLGA